MYDAIYRQYDWCFHNHGFWCRCFYRRANTPIALNLFYRYASLARFFSVTEELNPAIEASWHHNFSNLDLSIANSYRGFLNGLGVTKLNLHFFFGVRD
jgi:hypothetical protein